MTYEELQEAIKLATWLEQAVGLSSHPRLEEQQAKALETFPGVVRQLEKTLDDLKYTRANLAECEECNAGGWAYGP